MTPSPTIPAKTSEMQERIARAMHRSRRRCEEEAEWDRASLLTKTEYRKLALIAMKAMREPNMRMLAAAQAAWRSDPEKKTSTLWRAMLSAEISTAEGGKSNDL